MKLFAAIVGVLAMGASAHTPAYRFAKAIPLGAPDRWDYVVFDPTTRRVYVAHADRLDVVDARAGTLVGQVVGIAGGTHGTAISKTTGQGFTDDGRNGKVIVFDPRTLKVAREIPADVDADGIALDPATGHLFIVEGDPAALTVVDPKNDAAIATIKAGEKLEAAAAGESGSIYVAGEANGDMLRIDARSNQVVARWPTPGCVSPHGIAVDSRTHRAFMGCVNGVMMVVDTKSGRVVARLPIGRGSDTVAFDSARRRIFSSNGLDGTISIYRELSPDRYELLETLATTVSGRTMAVDPASGRLFVAAADTDPNPAPGTRPTVKPGTLRLLLFDPVH